MSEYIDYEYRVWDRSQNKWFERKQYVTALECRMFINYLVANGYDPDDFEIRRSEVRWETYAEVSVPPEEELVR